MAGLKDIAEAAGFSVRTVKRVLTDSGPVQKQTRAVILEVAHQLDYRPNLMARALKTGTSCEVGVLMHTTDELHMEKLQGIETVLRTAGYSLVVLFSPAQADDIDSAKTLLLRRPAGVVLFPSSASRIATLSAWLSQHRVPYSVIDPRSDAAHAVYIDRAQGVEESIRYLASKGRRRIVYLGPVRDRSRLDGYERAMHALGLPPRVVPLPTGSDQATATAAAVASLQRQRKDIDAIQAYSDTVAMTVLRILHNHGISIPDDIAVVGFDNRAFAELASPPLTTVAQPGREVGQTAAALLLQSFGDPAYKHKTLSTRLPTRLIVRESA